MSVSPTHPHALPFLPPKLDLDDPDILKALMKSKTELAELKGYSRGIPNPMLLVSPAIIQESVASSEIEAIHTTVVEVLQGEVFPESEQNKADKEVLRYRDAMNWGFKKMGSLALSTRLILGIHKQLLSSTSGEYRKQQNKTGNTLTGETIYMPPAAADIPELMQNWENFVNESEQDDMDAIIKCAIAHYQFEAIHPFLDGNGRAGRILMILQLVQTGVLTYPILYISGYINKNRPDYYRLLRAITTDRAWKEYLIFMLKGFALQAAQTKDTLFEIMKQYDDLKQNCRTKLPKIYSAELVDHLFSQPVTTPVRLAEALDIHYTTASKYLIQLKQAGLLKDKVVGKYHLYINLKLLSLLKS